MLGYLRPDGRKGIRNYVLVAYLVECAHHVARAIATPFEGEGVQLIGFPGCYPSPYAEDVMHKLCSHPNVGAVLLVSLGCEEFDRTGLRKRIEAAGRRVDTLVIQQSGGTSKTVETGRAWVREAVAALEAVPRAPMEPSELVVGTKCGGSDGTSGITANPAVGVAVDHLVDAGGTAMFEELGELLGCEQHMAGRAALPSRAAPNVEAVALDLSQAAFEALVRAIAADFDRPAGGRATPIARGLYRDSHFYPAHGEFHLFNTCNTWTARMLRAGGVKLSPSGVVTADDLMKRIRAAIGSG